MAAPRVKWHQLRRRRADPEFLRENLSAALAAGAACEVDIVFTADDHAFCLHDLTLDRETTGAGPAARHTRREIELLRQRGEDGAALQSAPLFLDEIAATVRAQGALAPASIQLDIKAPAAALTPASLGLMREALGGVAESFIAGGCDWSVIARLREGIPGLHAGYDPLGRYPRSCALSADEFRALGEATFATAPDAAVFYLEAKLVLAALARGVNLVSCVTRNGAIVDAWTIDADRPALRPDLERLIGAGCGQITSNDPEILAPLVAEIASATLPSRSGGEGRVEGGAAARM